MFKQIRTVVVVLGLLMAIAYCDRPGTARSAGVSDQSAVIKTTQSTGAPAAKSKRPDHGGHIAVIDLDRILKDSGHQAKIKEAARIRQGNLDTSVRIIRENMKVKLADMLKEIGGKPQPKGEKPTADEQKLIAVWESKIKDLDKQRLAAEEKITQAYEERIEFNRNATTEDIARIRGGIAPLAKLIAARKGLDVVVTSSSVLAHSDSADITNEVFRQVNGLMKIGEFPTVSIPERLKVKRAP